MREEYVEMVLLHFSRQRAENKSKGYLGVVVGVVAVLCGFSGAKDRHETKG